MDNTIQPLRVAMEMPRSADSILLSEAPAAEPVAAPDAPQEQPAEQPAADQETTNQTTSAKKSR